jgi:molecular chaperone GrpE
MKQEIKNPPSARPDVEAPAIEVTYSEPDALRQELAEQKDLNLRLAADFENFKRRSRQEGETRAAGQKESFVRELLPCIDNLERAIASGSSPGSVQFHQGVEMTLKQLRLLLSQHGIKTEEIVGQQFDPHQHEAVSQRHDPAQANHAILEVFQRGYRQGEKVFRPAKVVVNETKHTRQNGHAR